jgi:hypothetical protein
VLEVVGRVRWWWEARGGGEGGVVVGGLGRVYGYLCHGQMQASDVVRVCVCERVTRG